MLDGSKRKYIIKDDLEFPNGLAIDFEDKKLYWADALKDRIEMANLNGHNRVALVPELTHPFGLTQVVLFSSRIIKFCVYVCTHMYVKKNYLAGSIKLIVS